MPRFVMVHCVYREPHLASLFPSTYEQLPVNYEPH